jgi:hypothetical protein
MAPILPCSLRIVLAIVLAWVLAPAPARACAAAPPPGHTVTIEGVEAIILWDAPTGIEQFIRRASFETEAPGFGFIVPTPSVPELAWSCWCDGVDGDGGEVGPPCTAKRGKVSVAILTPARACRTRRLP